MTTTTTRPSQPSKATGPDGAGGPRTPNPATPTSEEVGSTRRRRRAIDPSSARALAMLTRQPISAASVPQLHIGPRGADGSIRVEDRASDRSFVIYTPRLESQFRAGYRSGLWYIRAAGDAGLPPRSPGFPTAALAIDTLRIPRGLAPRPSAPRCRVIWS